MFTSSFLQKRNRKQKRNKRKKKAYHSYHYSLCYYVKQRSVLPVLPAYTSAITQHFMGISLLVRPVDQTTKTAGSEALLQVVLCKVRSWCISQENQVGHKQILYQADQNFWSKKISYLIFFKKIRRNFSLLRK